MLTRPLRRFEADLGELSRIREFVTKSAKALGVVPAVLDDLRLVVDEAVTNIVVHGYRGPGEITVDLSAEGSDLIVRLCDKAPTFDAVSAVPDEVGTADSRTAPGGFGLYLIKQSMDDIAHRALHPGNELTMVKRNVVEDLDPGSK